MNNLFIFVEGNDDERYFDYIIIPNLKYKYRKIKIGKYSNKKTKYVIKLLLAIRDGNDEYIFTADYDMYKCYLQRKNKLVKKYIELENNNIRIIKTEIEGWYCAGLNEKESQHFSIPYRNTDNTTKEHFDKYMRKAGYDNKIHYMKEILSKYKIRIGIHRNTSLRYCIKKDNIRYNHSQIK